LYFNIPFFCLLPGLLAEKNPMSTFIQSEAALRASAALASQSDLLPERCILIITDGMASDLLFAPLDRTYMAKLDHELDRVDVVPIPANKGIIRSGFSKAAEAALGVPVYHAILQDLVMTTSVGLAASTLKDHLYAVFGWNPEYKPWAVICWAGEKDAEYFHDHTDPEVRFSSDYASRVSFLLVEVVLINSRFCNNDFFSSLFCIIVSF
jgi:hypothetical protein